MADIFASFTRTDQEWARGIAQGLAALHPLLKSVVPSIHRPEVPPPRKRPPYTPPGSANEAYALRSLYGIGAVT